MIYKSELIFSEAAWTFWRKRVKLDVSNYATKKGPKKATGVDKSNLASKSSLVKDKLKTILVDLGVCVLKTKYSTDKSNLKKKSLTLTRKYLISVGLLRKTDNKKITEMWGKIRSITGLATTTRWTAVENKIPSGSHLWHENSWYWKSVYYYS